MANLVLAQILRKNSYDYNCLHQESINCQDAVSEGFYWRIPTSARGVHTGFIFRKSDTKPTTDSVKSIRVRAGGQTYYVAVADNANDQVFTDACNACCDSVAPLATVTLPDIIIEESGCPDENGNYQYRAYPTDPLPAGSKYTLSGVVNGVALPAAPVEGFDSLAALETWADTNWSAGDLDGVTLDGSTVILNAGASGVTGGITVNTQRFFESNTPGALAGGQNYHLAATVNGAVLTPLDGAADAALSTVATLANNTAAYAAYGKWSVVGGKIRLVGNGLYLATASLVVTKIP